MPIFLKSTNSLTNEKNESFKEIIQNQVVRYKRKGYGLIVAFLIALIFFILIPRIFKFYWPFILTLIKPEQLPMFNLIFTSFIHFLIQVVFYIIYENKFAFFERYRCNQEKKWAWEEKDPQIWEELKRKIKLSLFYDVSLQYAITYLSMTQPIDYKWTVEDFPTSLQIMSQITFFMITEDFFFYWGHRIIHTPFLYKRIHKQHHEFKNPISYATVFLYKKSYAHPIEYILCNFLPFILGFVVLGKTLQKILIIIMLIIQKCHSFTILMWACIRIGEATDGHCGYEFSWSPYRLLPMSASASYHNYHQQIRLYSSHNIGNYGSFFTFWDTIFRTNTDFYKFQKQKEEEQQKLQQKKKN